MFFDGRFTEGLFILSFKKKERIQKMKNTNKIFSAIIALVLALTLTFSLIGCDVTENDGKETEAPATTVADTTASDEETSGDEAEETTEDANTVEKAGLWENATYLKDMTFGEGSKTVTVKVKAGDDTITFTIKTDKSTVGAALMEYNLIEGEESQYGLYVKKVNGILADYDVNQSYWAFYINGEYAMSGVDTTDIDTSAIYTLEYTK